MNYTHIVEIFDNNKWEKYFTCFANKFENDNKINILFRAYYYGSSTRIGKLGEVVSIVDKKIVYNTKRVRIREIDKDILFEFNLSCDELRNNFVNNLIPIEIGFPLNVIDTDRMLNGTVRFRNLNRFIDSTVRYPEDGCPIEISGISFEINKKN
jgi:hypothetical protein